MALQDEIVDVVNGLEDPDLFITRWIAQENALYENLADAYEPGASDRRLPQASIRCGREEISL